MNLLTLDIGIDSDLNMPTLLLYIDRVEFRRIICDNSNAAIFEELEHSLLKSGDYLIFSCSCGVADCGGWDKVNVLHNGSNITWAFKFGNYDYNFQFKKDNYEEEIVKIKEKIIRDNITLEPEYIFDPE